MGMDYSLVQRIIDGLGKILDTKPGSPDEGTYVTEQQLADWIKGQTVVPAYYYNGVMYSDALHTTPITGQAGALYIDQDNNVLYRWDGAAWDAMSDNQLRQDILDGTVVAKKAECDEDGNNIKATYATKVEMQAADANLNDACSALDKRVTNLELKTGDQFEVDYPSDTYGMDGVPSNVEPYVEVEALRGVTRADNQQMPIAPSFSRSSNGITFVSDGNGKYSISGLASANSETRVTDALVFPKGHRFLIATTKPMSYDTARIIIWVNNSQSAGVYYGGQWAGASDTAKLFTIDDSWNNETIWFNVPNGNNPSISDLQIIIRDLTQYFSSDPSVDVSTLTISDIQSNYPELLVPSDYDAGSIVDTTYSAVKSVGRNLFDRASATVGKYYDSTGNLYDNSNLGISDYMPVTPSVSYFLKSVAVVDQFQLHWFDRNKNWIGRNFGSVSNTSMDAPSGASYVRVNFQLSDSQVCFNKSDSLDGTYTPHMTDTLTLPESVTLKGAGAVADTDELNVEVLVDGVKVNKRRKTVRIKEADLGQCRWTYNYSYSTIETESLTSISTAYNWSALICAKYTVVNSNTPYVDMPDKSCKRHSSAAILVIKDSDITDSDIVNYKIAKLLGTKLAYETATYSVTLLDPILDPFIQVEGGGTIKPVQSQSPEVDSAMTVEYMAS